uniref:Uncharacterized protein n=1 Tax=Eutreptiella gymnastica TaxID=73025 RepID=A0A7S4GHF2_9EUGL|eukprot:CAMPEP_0174287508 /NCGR_PEP_ID=MMETSP0809-20121228/16139_1 /TAXON_ID=73025 ORGANISM="Eutreptiella gymnastica-like, Strain CCMP1594" /NCGR_SAMPLE_ID=MMETSP0809 /ASSEMBLY_ACC=CAM_ASM_000658 /LENGTH=269 /DNA_ID=CAMNT_0015384079 /DNA_START=22 /DNA_END=831 /DNA_ORIENTATION=+
MSDKAHFYDSDLAAPVQASATSVAKLYAFVGAALCSFGAFLIFQAGTLHGPTQHYQVVATGLSSHTAMYPKEVMSLPMGGPRVPQEASLPTSSHKRSSSRVLGLFGGLFGGGGDGKYPIYGDESIMSQKAHGTTEMPVQQDLRWDCDRQVADRICSFNRHFAEYSGYWQTTSFAEEAALEEQIDFYDSVTGKLLFKAPVGRSMAEFLAESRSHGWPSFRDEEVVWENMRVVSGGEAVSVDGTHLGHNLPDFKGNRYCINLVSVAGRPEA